MRLTFKALQQFARERGYTVERKDNSRMIEWYRNEDHSMIGVVYSVHEAYSEIKNDFDSLLARATDYIILRSLSMA